MLFNSYEFIFVFLPLLLAGYALATRLPGRAARRLSIAWLVLGSLAFYGWWNPAFLWVIVASVAANYAVGRWLARAPSRPVLAFGISLNLALLGYFKYAGFFAGILDGLAGTSLGVAGVVLPLGISFFTFQQIAYLVDTHRRLTVAHGWLEYALFVTFFPQLIAGPIVHQAEILPQFMNRALRLRARNFAIGSAIFAVGLFKKVVLADTMAGYATPMFDMAAEGQSVHFFQAWGGTLAYTLQLYFDFSGYSDMAIGLARLFGVKLPLNFHSPYKATSIIDFWRRWHMTLSRFLRDYLYYPLGGNRLGVARRYVNLAVVMLLGGLWHGAGWTFVAWGALHGGYLVVNHGWRAVTARSNLSLGAAGPVLSWLLTFLAVAVGWVFFRAVDFAAALNMLTGMAGIDGRLVLPDTATDLGEAGRQGLWLAALMLIAVAFPNTQEWMSRYAPSADRLSRTLPRLLSWRPTAAWAVAVLGIFSLAIGFALRPTEFLYWQF